MSLGVTRLLEMDIPLDAHLEDLATVNGVETDLTQLASQYLLSHCSYWYIIMVWGARLHDIHHSKSFVRDRIFEAPNWWEEPS